MHAGLRNLTRPQRQALFWALCGVAWALGAAALLAPSRQTFFRPAPGSLGTKEVTFGVFAWLTHRVESVTLTGRLGAGAQSAWSVNGPGVVFTVVTLAALTVAMILAYRRFMRRRGPVARCDECGYDLRVARGDRCPECGTPVEASSSSSVPHSGHTPDAPHDGDQEEPEQVGHARA